VGHGVAEGVVLGLGVNVGLGLDVGIGLTVGVGLTTLGLGVTFKLEPEEPGVGDLELLELDVFNPVFLGGSSYPHEINNVKTTEAI
jgi:hypothetical protein